MANVLKPASKVKGNPRAHRLKPDEIAPHVKHEDRAKILAYENDKDELVVSVLYGYAKPAGLPVENLLDDDRDLCFGHRVN